MVRQVGLGLQALHDHGVLHRDVKPANVLFRTLDPASGTARGDVRAMLGDLGLGKALDMSSRLTMIAGTPTFVAPEQAQGEHLDARADQYSLGALTLPAVHRAGAVRPRRRWPPRPRPASRRPLSVPGREFPDGGRARSSAGRSRRPASERWPDVTAYVAALREALGDVRTRRRCRTPWLPLDPELTQPGARPTSLPAEGDLPDPTPPERRRRRRGGRWPSPRSSSSPRPSPAGWSPSARCATTPTVTDDTGR